MCVAALVKPGAIITPDRLWAGWLINRDGGGFAYIDENGEVVIKKGFFKYNAFQKAYMNAAEKYAESSPFLVHMRIKTAGSVKEENCHPFKIKDGAMIHNGSLFYPTGDDAKSDKSDTRIFAERFHNILKLEDVLRVQEDILFAFGRTNKLVFLYNDKRYAIVNEKTGFWYNDVWYSNASCTPYRNQVPPTAGD